MNLTRVNKVDNLKALMLFLSYTRLVSLALDVCYVLISCCPLPNSIFLLIAADICSKFFCV